MDHSMKSTSHFYYASDKKIVFNSTINKANIADYSCIFDNLDECSYSEKDFFEIDICNLDTMNGAGIMILSLLLIKLRNLGIKVRINAAKEADWVGKVAEDLKLINSTIEIQYQTFH